MAPQPTIDELDLDDITAMSVDQKRRAELKQVREHIEIIYNKQLELKNKSIAKDDPYDKAAQALAAIFKTISKQHDNYVTKKISKEEFIKNSSDILSPEAEEVKTLSTHRGIKQTLVNLLTAILSLGIFYGIAAACKGSFTLFPVKTDSAAKLDALHESIDEFTRAGPV